MYAVICTGGKQYRVSEGDVVYIEKLDAEADSTVQFDHVLAVGKDDGVVVGAPTVDGAVVTGKVVKMVNQRRLPFSPIVRRRVPPARWVTGSPIPRSRFSRSRLNNDRERKQRCFIDGT